MMLADPDPWYFYDMHRGDTDRDQQISLSELLRVIELYNNREGTQRTGAYRFRGEGVTSDQFGTVDTSSPGGIWQFQDLSRWHSADSDRDGSIGLPELLRFIELYNYREGTQRTGRYHVVPSSPDGAMVGPEA